MSTYRIAVIPGDGIGTEVVPEGLRVLQAAAGRFGFTLDTEHFDFASADYYERHGQMLPDDWFETLKGFDALFFGAVGWPEVVPDHISLWGSLLQFRRHFDQYVSLRPVKLLAGVPSPLAGRQPGEVDFLVVRENTEGEYSSIGGKMFEGTDRETVIQETVMTRTGVDRIVRYAFELAQRRDKHLTSATKSNGISITMPYWDERVAELHGEHPEVRVDKFHIDILTANFVLQETVMSRIGVDRVLRHAFEVARSRPKKHLTSATKSNGIAITMPYWDERVVEMAKQYPDVTVDKFHIDILTAHFVQRPDFFDVVVGSNLFGDILSDLGPACTGTIGIAPSANLNPTRTHPSLFEPVHGSAPDIAGKGIANPIGQIWCGAMMLDHLGHRDAHDAVMNAIEAVLQPGSGGPRTPDLGGTASTADVGLAIAAALVG